MNYRDISSAKIKFLFIGLVALSFYSAASYADETNKSNILNSDFSRTYIGSIIKEEVSNSKNQPDAKPLLTKYGTELLELKSSSGSAIENVSLRTGLSKISTKASLGVELIVEW